jgi:hypothetical protein
MTLNLLRALCRGEEILQTFSQRRIVIVVGISERISNPAHFEVRAQISSAQDREAIHFMKHEDCHPLKGEECAIWDPSSQNMQDLLALIAFNHQS